MVTCKKHPSEPDVGVCAACLRDRLLGLDSCLTPTLYPPPSSSSHKPFQPLQDHNNRPLFFAAGPPPLPAGKKAGGGFSVLSTLFGSGGPSPSSGERERRASFDDNPSLAPKRSDQASAPAVPPSFSSWLAALFAVRCKRNNQKRRGSDSRCGDAAEKKGDAAARQRATCRLNRCRGMSPRSEPEEEEEDQPDDRAAAAGASPSGCSSGSSEGHPVLPGPTPARNNMGRRDGTAVKTGFAVCFSPLVRPRPHHHRRSRVVAGDGGGGAHYGEVQKPGLRLHGRQQQQHQRLRQGGGVKLCTNRSRKLVDMGRFR